MTGSARTAGDGTLVNGAEEPPGPGAAAAKPVARRRWYRLSNISGVYSLILIVIIFSSIDGHDFARMQTIETILNQSAVPGIIALAMVIPLAAGVFDLSAGYVLGWVGVVAAWFLGNTGLPVGVVILLALGTAVLVALFNAIVIVAFRVESIIATLGSGSVVYALTYWVSGDTQLSVGVAGHFSELVASASFHGLTVPVFVMAVLMILIGWASEQTQAGRYTYAVGFDPDVAKLSGLRVGTIRVVALIICSVIAGVAGLCLTGQVQSASPDAGPSYVLPAFAGVFLGATQIRAPRFNAWGTVLAVLVLATGNYGLLLSGGPSWTPMIFNGLALIIAVAAARISGGSSLRTLRPRRRRRAMSAADTDALRVT
jgi:ribose transport system permease protein